jgi:hypothetical protein
MHISQFAKKLECQYCHKPNKATEWPIHGDMVAFYYQTKPGKYQIKVLCPECNKEWFVAWDENPGPIQKLDF